MAPVCTGPFWNDKVWKIPLVQALALLPNMAIGWVPTATEEYCAGLILLVDDESAIRPTLTALLGMHGFK